MSNREKEILNTFVQALPVMSDFDKGYVLGIAESRLKDKKENEDSAPPVKAG